MDEAEAGEVLASLAAVSGGTLADVVIGARLVHADAVLAVVLLTRRGLGVEVGHHGLYLTKLARELGGTLARVFVDTVATRPTILTHVVGTVIHIGRAVLTNKAKRTVTSVMGEMIFALATVLTRILAAEGNLLLTISSLKARHAAALVGSNLVNAGAIVLAAVVQTIVNIHFTSDSFKPRRTLAPETTLLSTSERK